MSPHGALGADRFGRLFDLPPCGLRQDVLERLGKALMFQGINRENPRLSQGYTYLGQFIDHDLTFSVLPQVKAGTPVKTVDPKKVKNKRTARFDLDSLYGLGPEDEPKFYEADGEFKRIKLRVGGVPNDDKLAPVDLPRVDGKAVIPDERNDEHHILTQMHMLFQKFHNLMVDELSEPPSTLTGTALFAEARKQVTLHYQHLVLHDFLPAVTGRSSVALLNNRPLKGKLPADGALPVEFSGAAYRFGHSMVRDDYKLRTIDSGPGGVPVFSLQKGGEDDDLHGRRPLTRRNQIFWTAFFQPPPVETIAVNKAMAIDHRIVTNLIDVPPKGGSLPVLNLLRGLELGLPSGRAIADAIPGLEEKDKLDENTIWGGGPEQAVVNLDPEMKATVGKDPPLWFYILREAAVLSKGRHLGPVGATIVSEVFISALENDPDSILTGNDDFEPALWPGAYPGEGLDGRWSMFFMQAWAFYFRDWDWFLKDNGDLLKKSVEDCKQFPP